MSGTFHQGILRPAMEPSPLGTAFVEGGLDRKIKLDRSPGVDEVAFVKCYCNEYYFVTICSFAYLIFIDTNAALVVQMDQCHPSFLNL